MNLLPSSELKASFLRALRGFPGLFLIQKAMAKTEESAGFLKPSRLLFPFWSELCYDKKP